MYKDGQIITKEEHIAFATWNNTNGGKFRSESLGNGTYKIVEIIVPEPTEREQMQERIAALSEQYPYFVYEQDGQLFRELS